MQSNTQQRITFQSKNAGFFKVADNCKINTAAFFDVVFIGNYKAVARDTNAMSKKRLL